MGLKGYRLWVMGQLDSTYRAPPPLIPARPPPPPPLPSPPPPPPPQLLPPATPRDVALQVAFEKANFETGFSHLIGYRLWVLKGIGYGLWVNLILNVQSPTTTPVPPPLLRPTPPRCSGAGCI
jgi:hypothetical protein